MTTLDGIRCLIENEIGEPMDDPDGLRNTCIALIDRLSALEHTLREKWREHLDEAVRCDDDGSPVGFATYHRNVARGLEEALAALAGLDKRESNA